jgi:hypothetical protein
MTKKIGGIIVGALILLGLVINWLFSGGLANMVIRGSDSTPPQIHVWYGDRQQFGQPALAQRWVNILGNADDPQSGVKLLRYTLNGSAPVTLRMGPDQRRLVQPGDFNIEIDPASLRAGDNQVTIEATNRKGLTTTAQVTLNYQPPQSILPLPYLIDWSKVKNAQDVLQIVDGNWRWDTSGIRTTQMGYDRFLVVGDSHWTDYQVTVPVTVHSIDPAGFHDKNSGEQASISIDLHWIGHSDDPVQCAEPHCGWNPVGDFNKFFFRENGKNYLGLKLSEKEKDYPTNFYKFDHGDTYIFKVNVQSTPQGDIYRMKVWEPKTQSEPADWTFQREAPTVAGDTGNARHGAFALVAHYVDVTFGNILVEPIK